MFGKKTILCPAGQWTTIIRSNFAQLPATWYVDISSKDGDVTGEFEETKSAWIFQSPSARGPLRERLCFERGYWNTFYRVRIRPQNPVVVKIT